MKTLNLVNEADSEISYKISRFPDGQQQVVINYPTNIVHLVNIQARLNSFTDLERIICSVKSLRELGIKEINLYVPYFLGCRSDRKFEEGGNNYLKDVICPIINSLNFESVIVLDPHSDVLEACLLNFKKKSNIEIAKWALGEIYDYDSNVGNENIILISPDAGANKKIYSLAEDIEYEGEIITCSKIRDIKNGKILETIVPESGFDRENKDFIIIDDICDGGRTFIEIAKVIKTKSYFTGKIYLIVTHGIFSNGYSELKQYFDGIYCTNSYRLCQSDSTPSQFIKQLNIF